MSEQQQARDAKTSEQVASSMRCLSGQLRGKGNRFGADDCYTAARFIDRQADELREARRLLERLRGYRNKGYRPYSDDVLKESESDNAALRTQLSELQQQVEKLRADAVCVADHLRQCQLDGHGWLKPLETALRTAVDAARSSD